MTQCRVLIAGSGYVGSRLADRMRQSGHLVWTIRRSPSDDPFAIAADLTRDDPIPLPDDVSHVVFCAGLNRAEPEAYQALFVEGQRRLIRQLKPYSIQRYCFTSTTGVFGQLDGSWVDESTPPSPARPAARQYWKAEQLVREEFGARALIARLSGIYGPGRERLIRSVQQQTARRNEGSVLYMNHIHVDDITGALEHLLFAQVSESLYLITDSEPADRNEVLRWLATQLKVPIPKIDPDWPLGRGGNKRCDNTRLRESGYTFQFPTYREGYGSLMHG